MVAFAVMLMRCRSFALLAGLTAGLGLWLAPAVLAQAPVTAFVGATPIDVPPDATAASVALPHPA
jgi:hypothetical protein